MLKNYKTSYKRPSSVKAWILVLASLVVLLLGGVWAVRTWYFNNLRPLSSSQSTSYFTVVSGDSVHTISLNLQHTSLIRNSKAFEGYVRNNEIQNLQAGTYVLSPSMSVQQIVKKMVNGEVAKNLLTILPAKRLDQIKQAFRDASYSQAEVDAAFNPDNYRGHAALASLPAGTTLEGYLYPDSFQKQADTPATTIVRESLDEMEKYLTTDITDGFTAQGLTLFQGITLTSVVLQEASDPDDQSIVSQVFLRRLKQSMKLESDPTAFYASALAGVPRGLAIESPYNTYLHLGLPPGPIGNVTKNALKAVAHPANTDYLYFVAGDDGVVHFTHSLAEHEEATRKYCTKLCQ
ncbi:endolytic transglycosylase MltG [Candidatus Saccharibacteria bacterium CG10_big_fil_rev_8_21_14_0_10_47_8]|nr:MAG: endolytic transglycosylase MltG [Candidatus Saccharibacteria bacterium CG10_big_fil_rev_8_21_14_0_10_47_8]